MAEEGHVDAPGVDAEADEGEVAFADDFAGAV